MTTADDRPADAVLGPKHEFPVLDGLRGVAVLLVLMVHVAHEAGAQLGDRPGVAAVLQAIQPVSSMGGTGVHLFFVLSGFLLFLPYARSEAGDRNRPSARRFYARRALRILPAYYVVVTLTALAFERGAVAADPWAQVLSHLFLVHNYSERTFSGINGPTWTMAVEGQFYVLLPALAVVAAVAARRGERWLLAASAALLLASPVVAALGVAAKHVSARPLDLTFLTSISFLSVFGAGMLAAGVYVLQESGRLSEARAQAWGRAGLFGAVVIFGALVVRNIVGVRTPALDYYAYAPLLAACYVGLLLHVVLNDGAVRKAFSRRWLRRLGDISYSVYLVHYPLIEHVVMPLLQNVPRHAAVALLPAAVVAVVLPVAFLSFWCVERPFLLRKQRVHPV